MIDPNIPDDIAVTVVDPRSYADGDAIDEAFAKLRKDIPLGVAGPQGFEPFWVVTKHKDIVEVERNGDVFHNGDKATTLVDASTDAAVREMMGGSPHLVRSLVQMDNPDHKNYRGITAANFMPQELKALEVQVRKIAKSFVDHMEESGRKNDGRCDFAKDVAFLYPLHVIMELLGVPQSDEPKMLKLTQELFGAADPDLNRTGKERSDPKEALAALSGTVAEFIEYFSAVTEDRRKTPRADIASVIANGKIEGEALGVLEAMSYYIIVATAGHDTTSGTTAGTMWELAKDREKFLQVKEDPKLIPLLVEESIRWVTPVKHFMRSATQDTVLGGQEIKKGDWMMLCYQSGNRDEDIFDDPFEFKVNRQPNRHIAFGHGAHICLGQHLARMEMRALWEELLPRLDSVELDGEPTRMLANFVCGPKSVPIKFKMS
ncbi:MAG: cytochrome P450 [Pseudomonadota bacterium]